MELPPVLARTASHVRQVVARAASHARRALARTASRTRRVLAPPLRILGLPFASLPARIITSVFAAALVASLAVTWIATRTTEGFLREKIDQKFPQILRSASERLDLWYAQREMDVGTFAHSGTLADATAAGLLTDIGSLAYSVTKHAAVAFAEWMAVSYGDAGIRVSCLCPQGVRTPMLAGVADAMGGGGHLTAAMIEPDAVADAVVAGLEREAFLILPHPEVHEYAQRKAADPDRWLRGMARMRARLYGAGR